MSNPSQRQLESLLLSLRLVDLAQLQECQERVGGGAGVDLLDCLEQRHHLTSLQVQRIRKGETEGLVLGDYKLMYRNASGSFARVYRACSLTDGRMIGIKVLRERWSKDPDTVSLFHREGETGMRLHHPNIVPVYECAQQGDIHYITMDFVEGGNLKDFIKIRGKLEPAEAMRYGLHMAEALAYAFGLGVTHRDMKTTNVLLTSQGIAKLIDFGLATDEEVLRRLGDASFAQALEYSTLERHSRAPTNDPRSDLFFMGVILYELLAGEPPYPRTRSRDERRDITRYRDIKRLSEVASHLPSAVTEIVDKLTEADPTMRYQAATHVVADIRSVLGKLAGGSTIITRDDATQVMPATIMCIEDRPKFQDWLREYLSRHGFRVLLLNDVERGLSRVTTNPPDCLLLMGGSIGSAAVDAFRRAASEGGRVSMATVLVLSERQQGLADDVDVTMPTARILQQPIQLRELRQAITDTLAARG
jgi:eukaryotic-like serine/threonine-protein kinase